MILDGEGDGGARCCDVKVSEVDLCGTGYEDGFADQLSFERHVDGVGDAVDGEVTGGGRVDDLPVGGRVA